MINRLDPEYKDGTKCRVVPHVLKFYMKQTISNWSDDLNSVLLMILIAMSNQIPQILALKIFWVPKNNKEV